MPSRTLAGRLALKGDWNLGEDLWKDENDLNLLKLSVIAGGAVDSIVAATPGAPAEGDVHIFSDAHPTNANQIAVYDEAGWDYIVPWDGLILFNEGDSTHYTFTTAGGWDAFGAAGANPTESLIIALGDEATAITAGTAKVTFRMPYAFTLTDVRASLTTAGSGETIIDLNEGGVSVLSTKLTIDATEKTSQTGAVAEVISDTTLADDAEMTIDIDTAGALAAGLKVALIGYRP